MKKGVLIIIFLSVLMSITFVYAGCHPICNPDPDGTGPQTCDPNLHGVYIDRWCFNCGANDGICPEDFGIICIDDDPDCPPETRALWSLDNISIEKITDDPLLINTFPNGKILYMVVEDTGLSTGTVNFMVYEDDTLDDKIGEGIEGEIDENGIAIGIFEINDAKDLNGVSDPEDIYEIFFMADVLGDSYSSDILNVNLTLEEEGEASVCGDYDVDDCNKDPDGAAEKMILSIFGDTEYEEPEGCTYFHEGNCTWNFTGTEECNFLNWTEEDENNDPDICEEVSDLVCGYSEKGRIGDCKLGDDFFKVIYNSTQSGCEGWTSNLIPCPEELRVPFFGFYGFIISILIIGLIYFFKRQEI